MMKISNVSIGMCVQLTKNGKAMNKRNEIMDFIVNSNGPCWLLTYSFDDPDNKWHYIWKGARKCVQSNIVFCSGSQTFPYEGMYSFHRRRKMTEINEIIKTITTIIHYYRWTLWHYLSTRDDNFWLWIQWHSNYAIFSEFKAKQTNTTSNMCVWNDK